MIFSLLAMLIAMLSMLVIIMMAMIDELTLNISDFYHKG